MIEERRPVPGLPESIGALAAMTFRAYRQRLALFLGVTVAGFLVEAVMAWRSPDDLRLLDAGQIVVDAFISAVVSIGIVSDLREGPVRSDRAIALAGLERWGVVSIVTTIVACIEFFTGGGSVSGPPEATGYGFLLLPIFVLWGSIGFASVIAATDQKSSTAMLVFSSIGRSMSLSFARPNFGRLVALALVAGLPVFVETILADQLGVRKIPNALFFASVPVDVLVTGPLQALFTVFYLDFIRRAAGTRAR